MFIIQTLKFSLVDFEIKNSTLKCYKGKKLKSQHDIINSEFSTSEESNLLMLMIYEDGTLMKKYPIGAETYDDVTEGIDSVRAECS